MKISSNKNPRRGLKKAIWGVLHNGLAPSLFGSEDIKKGLKAKGWLLDVDYNSNSLIHAINDLVVEGCVVLKKDGRRVKDRIWSYTPKQASSSLIPSQGFVDKIVEAIADRIASKVKQKLGL